MEKLISEKVMPISEDNGWRHQTVGSRDRFKKDGYEVWFPTEGGFELTIVDPETGERKIIFRHDEFRTPLSKAVLIYILENAETVVSQCE